MFFCFHNFLLFLITASFVSVLVCINPDLASPNSNLVAYPSNDPVSDLCMNKSPGLYCDSSFPDEILHCPSNIKKKCPHARSCLSIGKVPDCYYCELPFDVHSICKKMVVICL